MTTNLLNLPTDIFFEIYKHFSLKELINLYLIDNVDLRVKIVNVILRIADSLDFEKLLTLYQMNDMDINNKILHLIQDKMKNGVLSEYGLRDLQSLGHKYPFISSNIIPEIENRLSTRNDLMSLVISNPQLPWDYAELCRNPNITMKDVLDNSQIPWNYSFLSIIRFRVVCQENQGEGKRF